MGCSSRPHFSLFILECIDKIDVVFGNMSLFVLLVPVLSILPFDLTKNSSRIEETNDSSSSEPDFQGIQSSYLLPVLFAPL